MALEKFKDTKFKPDSLERIQQCNDIIDDYQAQGLKLTLRLLYYQLVSKNVVPNTERSYQNLSALVTSARLAGMMDWDAIEDRGRVAETPSEFSDLEALVDAALRAYRLPRWQHQDNYVELWVEKQALAGVLQPIAREYHITLMVNKGYSSASAMYESAQRFLENEYREKHADDDEEQENFPREFHLLYLGDHDPSGEDMVRDVRERLELFGAGLAVHKVALTMAQVRQHNPPPNPAKVTDPRAEEYIKKHGNHSWEVDALPPQVLNRIIRHELDQLIDRDRYDEVIEQEKKDKELLKKAVASLRKKKA